LALHRDLVARLWRLERKGDVEAIKQSMNAAMAPPTRNLAENLPVAEALKARRTSESLAAQNFILRQPIARATKIGSESNKGEVGWGGKIRTPNGWIKIVVLMNQ
jgi:hypothetical protein